MAADFLDLFSDRASTYAIARPSYPEELYRFLAPLAPGRTLVWDCATGNGQAARDLARHFDRVIATDASAEQIAQAAPAANVEYRIAAAETSGLPDRSVDMVAVAQALHWLDLERFYAEVRRVTVERGILAAWSYGSCRVSDDIDPVLQRFEHGTLAPFWHAARRWVDEGYRTIPFSFAEIPAPTFQLRMHWDLNRLGMYLSSWSAVAAYRRERGDDPIPSLLARLADRWGPADRVREITWPLSLRVGRVT